MKTKVRKHKNKRKSLKRATKNATKKATKKTTKRQKKSLNYKNRNTRKNKKGGDAAVPIVAATVLTGAVAVAAYRNITKINNNNSPSGTKNNRKTNGTNGTNNNPSSEDEKLDFFLKKYNLDREEIPDDGNCLFTAFLKFLNTSDQDLYENADKLSVEDPKLSQKGLKKVQKLRKEMVGWMQSRESKEEEDGQTFWEKYGEIIIEQEPYYDRGEQEPSVPLLEQEPSVPLLEHMYKDLNDYVAQMTRVKSDPDRPRAQFGGPFEILALFEKHKEDLKDIYASKEEKEKEGALLLYINENNDGTLFLQTYPDDDTMNLKTNINTNLPILLLLKNAHFVILKPKNTTEL